MDEGKLTDYVVVLNELLKVLSEKELLVVNKRYGLNNSNIQTLAAIGTEFGITRERVRQIQENALKKLKRHSVNFSLSSLHIWFDNLMKSEGGIVTEAFLKSKLVEFVPDSLKHINELLLACEIYPAVKREHNKVDYEPHFRFESISFANISSTVCSVIVSLKETNEVKSLNQLYKNANKLKSVSLETFKSILKLNRKFVIDERGVSLLEWRSINPKTLYDKILFVLNDIKEPLHFSEIAKKIENQNFDSKTVSTQAVHNELINNPIFVLIGRGIYALKTWGYKEGTVSDVIESILSKSGPMHLYDLTQEVLQRRKVKSVTVQINLNSKKSKFRKNRDGMYELAN